ncbi:MAG: hypothetical protein ACC645_04860 [Pirellulales bacterium]
MASGTVRPEERAPGTGSAKLVEYDQYIDKQIRRTRQHVKAIDIAGAIMMLSGGICALLLLAAVLDHWVITGGLGIAGRTAVLLVLIVSSMRFFARRLLPLLTRRINPVYAAQAIEAGTPTLKNSLLNFVFFRQDQAAIPRAVYETVEEQAATRLAHASVETTIDRSHLIHVGYGLLSIVIVAALYTVLSPKSPFVTVERILFPWADIGPPTRVEITAVAPGDTTVARGESITVTAQVAGTRPDEPVHLFYTTAGQQTVDRKLVLHVPAGRYRYACRLPEGTAGVRQELTYRIEAGDAVAGPFHVAVTAAPTIVVQRIEYAFPAYTGWEPRQVDREGDIKAIEGTRVTIHALANEPIRWAAVEFDGEGQSGLRMKTDGTSATVHFQLMFDPARQLPRHDGYLLRFRTETGRENLQPVRYRIEVTPDLAPEIEWESPRADQVDLPLDGALELAVRASDPDFALGQVAFHAAIDGRPAWKHPLLDQPREELLQGKATFRPHEVGAKVGELVTLWAVAVDNKRPEANRRETDRKRIRITPPQGRTESRQADGTRPNRNDPGSPQEERDRREASRRQQEASRPNDHRQGGQDEGSPRDHGTERQENGQQEEGRQQGQDEQPSQGDASSDQSTQGGQPDENRQAGTSPQQSGESDDESSSDPASSDGASGGGKSQDRQSGGQSGQGGSREEGGSDGDSSGEPQAGGRSGSGGAGRGPRRQRSGEGDASESGVGDGREDGPEGRFQREGANGPESGDSRGEETPQPVASDGSDDGTVFEELLKRLRQPPRKQPSAAPGSSPHGDADSSAEAPSGRQNEPANDGEEEGRQADRGRSGSERPAEPQTGNRPESGGEQAAGREEAPGTEPPGAESNGAASPVGDSSDGSRGGDQRPGGNESSPGRDPATEKEGQQPDRSSGDGNGEPDESTASRGANGETDAESARADAEKQTSGRAGRGSADSAREDRQDDRPAAGEEKNESGETDRSIDGAGGDEDHPKGAAGKGSEQQPQGAPDPQNALRPRPKSGDDSGSPTQGDQQQPKSPSGGKSESDSQGAQAGDKPGGGQEGGGQRANKRGAGSSGQNSSAEEGSGASNERGQGDASGRAGDDTESASPTGQPGEQSGGKGASKSSGGRQPGKTSTDGQPAGESPGRGPKGGGPSSGSPQGGGEPGASGSAAPQQAGAEPGGDPANLQYARQSTDLVLKRLQKELAEDRVDQRLLEELGWKKSDLKRFLHRWEKMYRDARQPGNKGEAARQELNETLRSLGLRRDRLLRRSSGAKDQLQQMQESLRTAPPWEYREQLRAYLRGISRAREQPER